ncbi:MAG: hypothetical protein ACFFCW_11210 [Candidatus Hodarchaeota archaeon]
MKKIGLLLIMLSCFFFLACRDPYVKAVRKHMRIEHVFSRPSTAYGPGSLVMYEKKSGYTGVCLPAWIIGEEQPKEDDIAEFGISKEATISFKVDLNVQDRAKLGQGYSDISKVNLVLKDGKQAEIITDLKKAFDEMGKGKCLGNYEELIKGHPKAKFYFIRVAYFYNLGVEIERENGLKVSGEIPKETLGVIGANIGLDIEHFLKMSISGEGLFIGFNGTPRKITPEIITKGDFDINAIKDRVINVTEWLK